MGVVLKQNTGVWTVTQTLYTRTGNCQIETVQWRQNRYVVSLSAHRMLKEENLQW